MCFNFGDHMRNKGLFVVLLTVLFLPSCASPPSKNLEEEAREDKRRSRSSEYYRKFLNTTKRKHNDSQEKSGRKLDSIYIPPIPIPQKN